MKLTKQDEELILMAFDVVKSNSDLYEANNLHAGCILKAKSGKIYKGMNIKSSHSICAEQVAIGQAFANGERELDTIVTASLTNEGEPRVVSPCGLCRYTFDKLNLDINVILYDINTNTVKKVKSSELLPYPYKRNV